MREIEIVITDLRRGDVPRNPHDANGREIRVKEYVGSTGYGMMTFITDREMGSFTNGVEKLTDYWVRELLSRVATAVAEKEGGGRR